MESSNKSAKSDLLQSHSKVYIVPRYMCLDVCASMYVPRCMCLDVCASMYVPLCLKQRPLCICTQSCRYLTGLTCSAACIWIRESLQHTLVRPFSLLTERVGTRISLGAAPSVHSHASALLDLPAETNVHLASGFVSRCSKH
jgi:hypothetical protein